jgi:cytoskeleton protein RodZ
MNTHDETSDQSGLSEEQVEPPSSAPAQTPGNLLRTQRETLELSLKQVSEQLNLTMHYINCMESDSYDKLPGDVFVKGYIRSYSRVLQLDPEQMIELYNEFTNKKAARKEEAIKRYTRRRRDKNRPWIIVSGIAFVVMAVALWFINQRDETPPVDNALMDEAVRNAVNETEVGNALIEDQPIDEVPVFNSPVEPEAASDASVMALAWPGSDELEIIFSDESWVELEHRGGDENYQDTHQQGEKLRITGTAPFLLNLGNARAASVVYNGRVLDISNNIRSDDSARLSVGMQ